MSVSSHWPTDMPARRAASRAASRVCGGMPRKCHRGPDFIPDIQMHDPRAASSSARSCRSRVDDDRRVPRCPDCQFLLFTVNARLTAGAVASRVCPPRHIRPAIGLTPRAPRPDRSAALSSPHREEATDGSAEFAASGVDDRGSRDARGSGPPLHRCRVRAASRSLERRGHVRPRCLDQGRRGGTAVSGDPGAIWRRRRHLRARGGDQPRAQPRGLRLVRRAAAFRHRRALHPALRHRGAEAPLAAEARHRRTRRRRGDERARHRLRPAGRAHARRRSRATAMCSTAPRPSSPTASTPT